ncbi:uncharacterized protein LOC6734462 isoform X1 [Drosophila simulans]|uniref:Uncharacterized protein, isoform B n=1 Tax=Drosophila simulans TaxID=7240 RepID=A0A0J9U1T1_DROSI|nr:uncharacterized protein LOC6734462 isoform X1 [Drosophila simulans]KMY93740.1 uncharacterized protein Dsimw501_GD25688, isoform B [Drosophila simulans]
MDDRGELSLVKKVVHSLVVSSPGKLTVEQLMRDYLSEEGCTLPYSKLGFKDAETFLRSIPDMVTVTGHGQMAWISAVATAKSAHIQQFVRCQKKSKNRSFHKPKYCYASEPSNLVFINERASKSKNRKAPSQTYQTPSNLKLPVSYPNYSRLLFPVHMPVVYANIDQMISTRQQQVLYNYLQYNFYLQSLNNPYAFPQSTFRPQRTSVPCNANSKSLKVNGWSQNGRKPEASKEQNHQTHPETSTENKQDVPAQELEKENEELAKAFENLSVDVAPIGHQEKLEYEIYEDDEDEFVRDPFIYGEVKDPDQVLSSEDGSDAVRPLDPPEDCLHYASSDDGDDENAIPSYAVDDRVLGVDYPKDAVRSDFTLPSRVIESIIEVQQRIRVQLVSLVNPHNFNFWIYNEEFKDYESQFANMQTFYDSCASENYTMPLFLITTDHLCVVRGTSGWERARVLGYRSSNNKMSIEVELVDIGDIICVCQRNVKFLLKQFALLPRQCLSGRLAFITQWKAPKWSAEVVSFFHEMILLRQLYAKVEAIKNNTAYLVLVDTETHAHTVNLNRSLIESGWVRRCTSA